MTKSSQTVFLMKYLLCLHVRGPPKKFQILISIFVRSHHTLAIPSCDMHPHVLWCNLKSVVFMIYKGKSDFNRSLCSVTFALREKLKSCGDFPSPPQKVQPLLRNQISMNIEYYSFQRLSREK